MLTFEEFECLPDHDEPGWLELLDGELIRKPPAFAPHMRLVQRVFRILTAAIDAQHGEVFIKGGYHLGQNWFVPDVSVTHCGQVESDGRYVHAAPALAVEVISECNPATAMERKILRYFEYGAREVWVLYPDTQSAAVHIGSRAVEVRGTLTTGLFPGLAIDLAQIFA